MSVHPVVSTQPPTAAAAAAATSVELASLPQTVISSTEATSSTSSNKVIDVEPLASPSANRKGLKNQAWSQLEGSNAEAAPPKEEGNTPADNEPGSVEKFNGVAISFAQQRMGAKFGNGDDETIEIRSSNNIILYMAVYFGTSSGFLFQDDCYWTFWLNLGFMAANWIHFYIVPKEKRKWETFADMFALTEEINTSKRVHWFIPYMMVLICQANTICMLCLVYVWGNQLPGYTRLAGRSAIHQTKTSWALESNDNAAQSLGQICMAFPIGVSAAAFFIFYAATRSDLGPRGKYCLRKRRGFLEQYHTTQGTRENLKQIVNKVESIAQERVKNRWTVGAYALIVILSIFNSLQVFILQRQMIWMAWQSAPGIVVVFLFTCLFVAAPRAAMLCYAMDYVSCYFLECSHWMDQLCFLELDLTNITDLLFWQELRNYYLKWKIPTQYHFAQMGFTVCLLMTVTVFTSIVMIIFIQGTGSLFETDVQIAFVISSISAVYLMITLTNATTVWDHQQQHTTMLDDVILKLRFRQALTSTPELITYTHENQLDEVGLHVEQSDSKSNRPSIVVHGGEEVDMNAADPPTLTSVSEKYALTGSSDNQAVKRRSSKPVPTGIPSNLSEATRYSVDYINRVIVTLERQITKIKELDPAPKIFGINVKPTLLRVMAGYCVSALAVVITKFFQG